MTASLGIGDFDFIIFHYHKLPFLGVNSCNSWTMKEGIMKHKCSAPGEVRENWRIQVIWDCGGGARV